MQKIGFGFKSRKFLTRNFDRFLKNPYSGPGVQGHAGKLIVGTFVGRIVVAMKGRFHPYEGTLFSNGKFPGKFVQTKHLVEKIKFYEFQSLRQTVLRENSSRNSFGHG